MRFIINKDYRINGIDMKLLQEMIEIADNTISTTGFDRILENLKQLRTLAYTKIDEGFMDNHRGDLDKKFDELEAKIIDARRTLGKINSNQNMDPEIRTMYKSNVMKNINKFRHQLQQVMKELGMGEREMQYHLSRIGLDREYGKPSEVFTKKDAPPEESRFRQAINQRRNLASPEASTEYKGAPKGSTPEKRVKWYQKLFR